MRGEAMRNNRVGRGYAATGAAILTLLNGCRSSPREDLSEKRELREKSSESLQSSAVPPPSFAFELPRGTSFGSATIAVSQEVRIKDGASVLGRTAGSFGTLASVGCRVQESDAPCFAVELDRGATTGSIRSIGSVALEKGALVGGDVTTEGLVRVIDDARVDGTTASGSTQLGPIQRLAWVSEPPVQRFGDVRVERGETRSLAPASYGHVRVNGGTLELTAGTYSFRSLGTRRDGTLRIVHNGQAVIAYVDEELQQSGAINDGGDPSHFLLAFSGEGAVQFRSPLRATVVAPLAPVVLGELSADEHQGTVLARDASVGARTTLRQVLFAHWGLLLQPRPVLECISQFTDDAFNAVFGYENELDIPLTIPRGPRNRLEPNGDGVLPESFAPGRMVGVFTTTLPATGVGYRLGSNLALAQRTSLPRCTGAEYQNLPPRVPSGIVDPDRPGPWDPRALERLRTGVP